MKSQPNLEEERALFAKGINKVAGVDEVGRGPLAGPVVTAAVILDPENIPSGLNDSKKLTEKKRELLFAEIIATSDVSVASLPAETIDRLNIRGATLLAMCNATAGLTNKPDHVLIDGRDIPGDLNIPATAIIKGDSRSLSIAAASIVAKVTRDRQMIFAAENHPHYGFEKHKGYGSAHHRTMIAKHGPCPLHRRSFNPVRSMLMEQENS